MKISISKQYLGDYTVLQYSVCSTVLYITTKTKPSHFSWTYIQYLYTFGKKEDADMFWLKIDCQQFIYENSVQSALSQRK